MNIRHTLNKKAGHLGMFSESLMVLNTFRSNKEIGSVLLVINIER